MATSTQVADVTGPRSMGHMALHYQTPDQGPLAARLLKLLGFIETQDLQLPDGSHFYRFVTDPKHQARGDGIIYLSVVPEGQRKLAEAMREALKIGTPDEHPAVGEMRSGIANDPEYSFHYGTLVESLEDLEDKFLKLQHANEHDPELKGRLKVTLNRPIPGDAEVDARLDASPLFGAVKRYAYGRKGVQAFLETDILASGVLGESMILEFDFIFPGAERHILSVVEMA